MLQLDYPAVNCRQCGKNFKDEQIIPDCLNCHVSKFDHTTSSIIAAYNYAAIWGELDHASITQALNDAQVSPGNRRLFRRCMIAMHRQIKEHYARQQEDGRQSET